MAISKGEIKGVAKGLILSIGVWWLAIPLREYLIEFSPIKNTAIIGAILIGIVLFWD